MGYMTWHYIVWNIGTMCEDKIHMVWLSDRLELVLSVLQPYLKFWSVPFSAEFQFFKLLGSTWTRSYKGILHDWSMAQMQRYKRGSRFKVMWHLNSWCLVQATKRHHIMYILEFKFDKLVNGIRTMFSTILATTFFLQASLVKFLSMTVVGGGIFDYCPAMSTFLWNSNFLLERQGDEESFWFFGAHTEEVVKGGPILWLPFTW